MKTQLEIIDNAIEKFEQEIIVLRLCISSLQVERMKIEYLLEKEENSK